MPEIVVTLDIGGSGVKASCFDPAGDVATTATAVRYPSGGQQDDGTFDPDVWAETATAALAQIVARCPALPQHYLGITVSAIRIPFVLLDADQRVVGPSLLNRDRRALPIVDDLVASIGHRELHRTTGHWAAPEFGLPKLLWIQRNCPDAWAQVRTLIQLHDWFIFRLCGAIASEASSAAMSQMMDITAGTWAYDLLASECGVRGEMLPEFAAAGTQAGGLLEAGRGASRTARGPARARRRRRHAHVSTRRRRPGVRLPGRGGRHDRANSAFGRVSRQYGGLVPAARQFAASGDRLGPRVECRPDRGDRRPAQ